MITGLAVLKPRDGELTVTAQRPGVRAHDAREVTAWPMRRVADPATIPEPTGEELGALPELIARG